MGYKGKRMGPLVNTLRLTQIFFFKIWWSFQTQHKLQQHMMMMHTNKTDFAKYIFQNGFWPKKKKMWANTGEWDNSLTQTELKFWVNSVWNEYDKLSECTSICINSHCSKIAGKNTKHSKWVSYEHLSYKLPVQWK